MNVKAQKNLSEFQKASDMVKSLGYSCLGCAGNDFSKCYFGIPAHDINSKDYPFGEVKGYILNNCLVVITGGSHV